MKIRNRLAAAVSAVCLGLNMFPGAFASNPGQYSSDLNPVFAAEINSENLRFTLSDLDMKKGDVLNLTLSGTAGDTIQVHFYYTNENGESASVIIGGLGGTVLDSKGQITETFTAPNALSYVTVKVVYSLSEPTYTYSITRNSASDIVDSGECGAEGDNVRWTLYPDGELQIYGTGAIKDYSHDDPSPWRAYLEEDIKTVRVLSGVTRIGNYAFCDIGNNEPGSDWDVLQSGVTSFALPGTVTAIGQGAFYYSSHLTAINIPSGVQTIEQGAFRQCERAESLELPNTLLSIGDMSFFNCSALQSVTIPDSVTDIYIRAFASCKALETIHLGKQVSMERNAVNRNPAYVFENCTGLKTVEVDENNPYYSDIDGVLFDKSQTKLILYPSGRTAEEYTVPEQVTELGERSFQSSQNLRAVTVPDSVTDIYIGAFASCKALETIHLGKQVSMERNAVNRNPAYDFEYCTGLKTVEVDENNPYYSDIDGVLFDKSQTKLILYPSGRTAEEYTVPEQVTELGEGSFRSSQNLRAVTVSDSVTKLGQYAFADCYRLKKAVLPASATEIPNYLFFDSYNLSEVVMRGDIKRVGTCAFSFTDLNNFVLPATCESVASHALSFTATDRLETIAILNATCSLEDSPNTISSNATIYGYPNSTAQAYAEKYSRNFVAIVDAGECGAEGEKLWWWLDEAGTLHISGNGSMKDWYYTDMNGSQADGWHDGATPWLSRASEIRAVVVHEGVTHIGNSAFRFLSECTEVTLPNTVKTIGACAFARCTALKKLELPASFERFSYTENFAPLSMVYGCTALEEVWVHNPNCVFQPDGTNLLIGTGDGVREYPTLYVLPDSTAEAYAKEYLLDYALFDVETGEIISAVQTFESGTCGTNLQWTLDSVGALRIFRTDTSASAAMTDFERTGAPWYAHRDKITSVTVEAGVNKIGDWAFNECEAMTEAQLPSGITSIGMGAFYGCKKLKAVELPETVSTILLWAFCGCDALTEMHIPANVTRIEQWAFMGCDSMTAYTVDAGNRYYTAEDGVLFTKSLDELLWYPPQKTDASYTVPDSVTKLGEEAFSYSAYLTEVTLPAGMTAIASCAFRFSQKLTKVALPSGLTEIGDSAFQACPKLANIPLPATLTTIGSNAFTECASLKDVTLPDGLTAIEFGTFRGCAITEITVPQSVAYIQSYAFGECDALKTITILNLNCEISTYNTIPKRTVICSYPGGTVETFAAENGYTFNANYTDIFTLTLPTLGYLVYDTDAKIVDVKNTAPDAVIPVVSEDAMHVSVHGANPGYGELTFTLANGAVYLFRVTVTGLDSTTTTTTTTMTTTSTTTTTTTATTSTTTMTTTPTTETTTTTTAIAVLKGDVNTDGVVDRADYEFFAAFMEAMRNGTYMELSVQSRQNADMNEDNIINIEDLELLAALVYPEALTTTPETTTATTSTTTTTTATTITTTTETTTTTTSTTATMTTSTTSTTTTTTTTETTTFTETTTAPTGTTATTTVTSYRFGVDTWSFQNKGDNFATNQDYVYFVDQTAAANQYSLWAKLRVNLDGADLAAVEEKLFNLKKNPFQGYKGSCYGLSVTSLLLYDGTLSLSDFTDGNPESVHAVELDNRVKTIINYYHALQETNKMQNILQYWYSNRKESEKLTELYSMLREGRTVLLAYYGCREGAEENSLGHAVIAYGIEPVRDDDPYSDGGQYTWRVNLYDCNRPNADPATDPSYCMYLNPDENNLRWCIPGRGLYSVKPDCHAALGLITDNSAVLNLYGAFGKKDEAAFAKYYEPIKTYAQAVIDIPDCDRLAINKVSEGGSVSLGDDDEEYLEYFPLYDDGTEADSAVRYAMRDINSGYAIVGDTEMGSEMRISMRYPDRLLIAESSRGQKASFLPTGKVKLETGENADYRISLVSNRNCQNNAWFKLEVTGKSNSGVSVQQKDKGWVLQSDSLKNVCVTAENYEDSALARFSSDYDSAYIYEIDSVTFGISVDTDGDGKYDTEIARSTLLSPGDMNGDGELTVADAVVLYRWIAEDAANITAKFDNADVNGDGTVTMNDVTALLRSIS